jgi:hypothetical protein
MQKAALIESVHVFESMDGRDGRMRHCCCSPAQLPASSSFIITKNRKREFLLWEAEKQ